MEHLQHVGTASVALFVTIILYSLGIVLYNIFFHPLRAFPGPKLLAATRFPYLIHMFSGTLALNHRRLHEEYGPIVRTAPKELSFSAPGAWKTIYGHDQVGEGFQKNPAFIQPAQNGVHTLLTADGENHRRNRRLLLRAFSEKALREQQHILEHITDLFIRRLRQRIESIDNGEVNLFDWYMWTLFDLIGDLSYGEPFRCLENGRSSEWVAFICNAFKTLVFFNICKQLAPLNRLVMWLVPKLMKEKRKQMFLANCAKVDRRLTQDTDRKDFLSYLIDEKDNGVMSKEEIYANATLFIIAGSDSTATTLAGLTYFLLRTPEVLKKTVDEIRNSFVTEQEISCDSVSRLVYLGAVISETLRMYPPFPEGLPRLAPREGAYVSGVWVPGGTYVQVATFTIHRSADNFTKANTFAPERWLGDPMFSNDNKEACQPFSLGPRSCIGRNLAILEIRLIIARLLWSFDMTLCTESLDWNDQLSWIQWEKKPLIVQLAPVTRP